MKEAHIIWSQRKLYEANITRDYGVAKSGLVILYWYTSGILAVYWSILGYIGGILEVYWGILWVYWYTGGILVYWRYTGGILGYTGIYCGILGGILEVYWGILWVYCDTMLPRWGRAATVHQQRT